MTDAPTNTPTLSAREAIAAEFAKFVNMTLAGAKASGRIEATGDAALYAADCFLALPQIAGPMEALERVLRLGHAVTREDLAEAHKALSQFKGDGDGR